MAFRSRWVRPTFALGLLGAVCATGEIQNTQGTAQVSIQEYRGGIARDSDLAFDAYPGTSAFPVQVLAKLTAADASYLAAAAAAAQFADPSELDQPNPAEFAVNLALNSAEGDIRYDGSAVLTESRDILYTLADAISPTAADGDQEQFIGKLFLDGALAVVAGDPAGDLTGERILLRVVIERSAEGEDAQPVFTGVVALQGAPQGEVTVASDGAFPVSQVILSDLGSVTGQSAVFYLLVLPNLEINYAYAATLGKPFRLTARLEIEAANVPGAGVAAVIGSPTNALDLVLQLTQGAEQAGKLTRALAAERADPSGQPAFPAEPAPLPPLCGALGLGPIGLALTGLLAGRVSRSWRTLSWGLDAGAR